MSNAAVMGVTSQEVGDQLGNTKCMDYPEQVGGGSWGPSWPSSHQRVQWMQVCVSTSFPFIVGSLGRWALAWSTNVFQDIYPLKISPCRVPSWQVMLSYRV